MNRRSFFAFFAGAAAGAAAIKVAQPEKRVTISGAGIAPGAVITGVASGGLGGAITDPSHIHAIYMYEAPLHQHTFRL